MFNGKTVAAILAALIFIASVSFGETENPSADSNALTTETLKTAPSTTLKASWGDYLHYTKIGRFDLAKGNAQAILESKPDPVQLLALSEENPQGYAILLRVIDSASDTELVEVSKKVLDVIEQGKFIRRTDPKIIAEEIRRLSRTERGGH